ncbi:MAG: hypothetical protein KME07_06190 [Pegethrix bostrychoides GSE-TBD4-15B]|uniref:Uncharacterized protein n=1 Tax=Pegethrix bostrychoides GSE-TBD4-15B TaxID=2839662 RepID=A0A951U442_9CYAN|nr:hypothetical protein [Pegethrix bostrychoides GSE-TBD4-15B]
MNTSCNAQSSPQCHILGVMRKEGFYRVQGDCLGSIQVQSELGKGSSFTVRLPPLKRTSV